VFASEARRRYARVPHRKGEAAVRMPAQLRSAVARPKGLERINLVNLRAVIMGILSELDAGESWRAWLASRRN
jgi:hypothetical protein